MGSIDVVSLGKTSEARHRRVSTGIKKGVDRPTPTRVGLGVDTTATGKTGTRNVMTSIVVIVDYVCVYPSIFIDFASCFLRLAHVT